jgi:hypothetical protein
MENFVVHARNADLCMNYIKNMDASRVSYAVHAQHVISVYYKFCFKMQISTDLIDRLSICYFPFFLIIQSIKKQLLMPAVYGDSGLLTYRF